ncbi:hypothetical protein [Mesorhizobium sp. KR1-2]|uniref:hypothetical protein n=1 Tax=Mesorhizobium sp. KR1-2 TaxID=3156609 RepID=UPI0032B3A894
METDAEAADIHTDPAADSEAEVAPHSRNAATFADAMRPMDSVPKPGRNSTLIVIAALVLLAIIVVAGAAMLR